jgi:uncharacterized membrane protein
MAAVFNRHCAIVYVCHRVVVAACSCCVWCSRSGRLPGERSEREHCAYRINSRVPRRAGSAGMNASACHLCNCACFQIAYRARFDASTALAVTISGTMTVLSLGAGDVSTCTVSAAVQNWNSFREFRTGSTASLWRSCSSSWCLKFGKLKLVRNTITIWRACTRRYRFYQISQYRVRLCEKGVVVNW